MIIKLSDKTQVLLLHGIVILLEEFASFIKVSVDITKEGINHLENSNSLQNTKVTFADKSFYVRNTMMLNMIEPKTCNAATL